jgi:hypothetical protein
VFRLLKVDQGATEDVDQFGGSGHADRFDAVAKERAEALRAFSVDYREQGRPDTDLYTHRLAIRDGWLKSPMLNGSKGAVIYSSIVNAARDEDGAAARALPPDAC